MRYNFIDDSNEHKYPPSYLPEDGGAISQNDVLYSHSRRLKISRVLWRVSPVIKFSDYDGWKRAQMPVEHFLTTRTAVISFYNTRWLFPRLFDRSGMSNFENPSCTLLPHLDNLCMSVLRRNMPSLTVTPTLKTSTAGNRGTAVAQWLGCCATNRKVAGSIPDGVTGIFHWHNPSDRIMALGSTQPLTEMSTGSISWG
jgi:hypothetical protein